jgi:single-strand DNA-binding protein
MNLNKVIIVGRLTQDPEKRSIPDSGMSVTSFSVATNSYFKNKAGERQEKTEFHNLVMFGNLADIASQYLKKGSLALFEGRLQTRTWDDKEGNKRYRTEIVVESLQLGPRGEGGIKREKSEESSPSKNREIPVIDEDDEINVEDIPF